MTTPHRTLQMALDALDAITDDVDGTGLNTMPSFDKAIDAIAALREALAPDHLRDVAEKAAPAAPVVPMQGGMDNNELLAAWQKKLPGRVPEGQELNAFAVGTEVGFEHAQKLERMDWDRVHHVLAKHGKHPGRTDDHLADVIDAALSAAPVVPLTEGRITAIANELAFGGGHCNVYELARAIEAAHGITGGSK